MRALLGLCRRRQHLVSLEGFRWLPEVHSHAGEHALTTPPRLPAVDQRQLPGVLFQQWPATAAAVQRQLHVLSCAGALETELGLSTWAPPRRAVRQHRGYCSQSGLADQLQKIQDDPDLLQQSHHVNRHSEWEVSGSSMPLMHLPSSLQQQSVTAWCVPSVGD